MALPKIVMFTVRLFAPSASHQKWKLTWTYLNKFLAQKVYNYDVLDLFHSFSMFLLPFLNPIFGLFCPKGFWKPPTKMSKSSELKAWTSQVPGPRQAPAVQAARERTPRHGAGQSGPFWWGERATCLGVQKQMQTKNIKKQHGATTTTKKKTSKKNKSSYEPEKTIRFCW